MQYITRKYVNANSFKCKNRIWVYIEYIDFKALNLRTIYSDFNYYNLENLNKKFYFDICNKILFVLEI